MPRDGAIIFGALVGRLDEVMNHFHDQNRHPRHGHQGPRRHRPCAPAPLCAASAALSEAVPRRLFILS